jgi:hypothetical protein
MADTEKLNEEVDRLVEIFKKLYEAAGRPVSEFKNQEDSIRKQIASGKSLTEVFSSLTQNSRKYDSFINRLGDTSRKYENTVKSSTLEYRVLNEQLRRGTASHKDAFESIQDTNRSIRDLEKKLDALEIESALTDPLDQAASALKRTEIEATRAALADLKKAESALKFTAAFRGMQSQLAEGLKQVPGIIGGALKKAILDHTNIAADPLTAASNVLVAGIGLAGKGVQGLVALIPVFGTGLSKIAEAATRTAQVAVEFLSKELKNTAESMKTLAAQGASFGGGLTEMREIALESGMNLQMFTNVMKNSRENILAMGMTGGEAARQIASVSNVMKTQLGPSGKSLRDELLAMGVSYEEQGEIQALYMAQIRASGRDLKNLAPAELATGTREYAKNLKVISDITGQDAKKLMERARAESMRGALMSKLTEEQRNAFTGAQSTLAALGPEFQNALVQMLAGGTVTDPVIAANREAMAMIRNIASEVQSGNRNIVADTQRAMSEAAEATRARTQADGSAVDLAVVLGRNLSGTVSGLAATENALIRFVLGVDAATRSATAAERQAQATDGATKGFVAATAAAVDFSNKISEIASENLETFGTHLDKISNSIRNMLNGTTGGASAEEIQAASQHPSAAMAEITTRRFVPRRLRAEPLSEMADGGITNGPAIAGEAGPEAVVPLPNGRSIPVDMDFSQMLKINNDMRSILSQMLGKMDESINTQRKLLENSY